MHQAFGDLTCATSFHDRIYVGDANGYVRCYNVKQTTPPLDAQANDVNIQHPLWAIQTAPAAITCICVVEDTRATLDDNRHDTNVEKKPKNVLVVVGSATNTIVFLRNQLEVRRYQLESAALKICHQRHDEFIVGDLLGMLYGIDPYEITWQSTLPKDPVRSGASEGVYVNEEGSAICFYPSAAQPIVKALASVQILDVEKTPSTYVLVSTEQKHLLMTHRGNVFAVIPTQAPIASLAVWSSDGKESEDLILVAGEEGIIYRLETTREPTSKETARLHFSLTFWAEVSFPVAKLIIDSSSGSSRSMTVENFQWLCLGTEGEVALFHGKEMVKEWNATEDMSDEEFESSVCVDMAVSETKTHGLGVAIVSLQRIRFFFVGINSENERKEI